MNHGSFSAHGLRFALFALLLAGRSVLAADAIDTKDMQRYCKGEAASRFDQKPSYISTQPVERVGKGYRVFGQFPALASNPTGFECRFNADRTLAEVRQTNEGLHQSAHPASYPDLAGKDREDSEKKLGKLGFVRRDDGAHQGVTYSIWWKAATAECIRLESKNGRVRSVEPTKSSRCQ